MSAIRTKYHGPTDTRGARVSASVPGHRAYIPYPHELSGMDVHEAAARALLAKLGYPAAAKLIGADIRGGYVFVGAE